MSSTPPAPPAALGNAVWHALTGPQADLGLGTGGARIFRHTVAPFCAVPDEPAAEDWADLAALLPAAGSTLFRPHLPLPPGWRRIESWPCYQMVLAGAVAPPDDGPELMELGRADVPEMIDLVERTQPGPFMADTIDTGAYLGMRLDGRLVAMAGERLRVPGAVEVSAVCADPAYRRRGLARRVLLAVARRIQLRGDLPFLHVIRQNRPAIALYDEVGFTVLRDIDAVQVGAPV